MKKELLAKTFTLGIVVLFIEVSCSSAISVETKTSNCIGWERIRLWECRFWGSKKLFVSNYHWYI